MRAANGARLCALPFSPIAGPECSGWESPIPLDRPEPPPFPVHVLPGVLRSFSEALAEEMQTPSDLPGVLSLTACSAALSRKASARVMGRWTEYANLYTMTVLPPSARKSAVMSAVRAPIKAWETEAIEKARVPIAERLQEIDDLKRRIAHESGLLASGSGSLDRRKALTRELAGCKPLAAPRLLVSDATMERLAGLLHEQEERIAVLSAESELLNVASGRYARDGGANLELLLSGYTGETYVRDRVGAGGAALILNSPRITLGLAVQPAVLSRLADAGATWRGTGFLSRVLFSVPAFRPGYANTRAVPMPPSVERSYHNLIGKLLRLQVERELSLILSPEADRLFQEFREWIEPQKREGGALEVLADWAGKIEGNAVRLALVIEGARWAETDGPFPESINVESMQAALELGRYFIGHARCAFARMEADPVLGLALRIAKWIKGEQRARFTRRDVQRSTYRAQRADAGRLDQALRLLETHEYIRRVEGDGKAFEVSPWIVPQDAQEAPAHA